MHPFPQKNIYEKWPRPYGRITMYGKNFKNILDYSLLIAKRIMEK